jgi:hypothetical protein
VVENKFWSIVKRFNNLMKTAVNGPNCLKICNGDCCSIKIDIPKVLAAEYIKKGFADKNDFIRGNVFSFTLRFDENNAKCFLFDTSINGCLVHNSGIKPPQCWIYPTNFSNPENKDIKCKRARGWKINDSEKVKKAEKLLKYYIFLCKLESKKESNLIKKRLNNSIKKKNLRNLLKHTSPSALAGFKDTWDEIIPLHAEGISLQMKNFCKKFNTKCGSDYFKCESICDNIIEELVKFLQQNLFSYVQNHGPDHDGEYSFLKLIKFANNYSNV